MPSIISRDAGQNFDVGVLTSKLPLAASPRSFPVGKLDRVGKQLPRTFILLPNPFPSMATGERGRSMLDEDQFHLNNSRGH